MDDWEALEQWLKPKMLSEKIDYWCWYAVGALGTLALLWCFMRETLKFQRFLTTIAGQNGRSEQVELIQQFTVPLRKTSQ